MALKIEKATLSQAKLRGAIYGPSGSGKTFTALRIARGLAGDAGRILLMDTERRTARKYSRTFAFDVIEMPETTVETYIEGITLAAKSGYDVLIIDSLSHAWQSLLEEVDKLGKSKYKGNKWSAWSEGTPKQKKLIDALLSYPGHLIATMRAKTEWTTSDGEGGKSKPTKVGLAPEQRAGVEYEFDMLIGMSVDHIGLIEKDRSGLFQDQAIEKPGEQFGKAIGDWLSEGEPARPLSPSAAPESDGDDQFALVQHLRDEIDNAMTIDEMQMLVDDLRLVKGSARDVLRNAYREKLKALKQPSTDGDGKGFALQQQSDAH